MRRCSVDEWQTYVTEAASNDEPHSTSRARLYLNDGGKAIEVNLVPCSKSDPCPAAGAVADGQIRLDHGLNVRVVVDG